MRDNIERSIKIQIIIRHLLKCFELFEINLLLDSRIDKDRNKGYLVSNKRQIYENKEMSSFLNLDNLANLNEILSFRVSKYS